MERPSQIPAFAPGDEQLTSCPIIVGRYADKGEAFTEKGGSVGQVSLFQLLFGDDSTYASANAVMVLEPEPDVINIQFFKDRQSLTARRFSKYIWRKGWNWDHSVYGQPYYFVNGFLQIDSGAHHGGAQGIGLSSMCRSLPGRISGIVFLRLKMVTSNSQPALNDHTARQYGSNEPLVSSHLVRTPFLSVISNPL